MICWYSHRRRCTSTKSNEVEDVTFSDWTKELVIVERKIEAFCNPLVVFPAGKLHRVGSTRACVDGSFRERVI